ncbi:MAG: ABC transporter permease [Treponema sp.]|nr:ABC transporter permease [Treponema sp.]
MKEILAAFFIQPWSSLWFLGNTLDYIGLLLTASLAAAFAFRGGTFNLGGEGQIYFGGLAASAFLVWVMPAVQGAVAVPVLCLAALAAMLTGALMGFVPGLLKKRFGANELITSFLISAALIPSADYLIEGPWRDQNGNLLAMPHINENLVLLHILPPSNLTLSFIFALLLIFLGQIFLDRTVWGYRFRISGAAPDFAHYGGINPERVWVPAMSVSGALSSLAGFFAVAGTYGRCHLGFSGGLGWSAIAVALIARNRPLALIPAALIYGWLVTGSNSALLTAGMKLDASAFILAAALIMVTIRFKKGSS